MRTANENDYLAQCQRLCIAYAWGERWAYLDLQGLPRESWTDWASQEGLEAILGLVKSGQEVSLISVGQWLIKANLRNAWEMLKVTEPVIPTPIYRDALKAVREAGLRKRLGLAAQQVQRLAMDTTIPFEDAEQQALLAMSQVVRNHSDRTVLEIDAMEVLRVGLASENPRKGILTTPFSVLDDHIKGIRPQQVTLIAARPKMGKTAFALQLARHIARTAGPVYFESLEMSATELVERSVRQVLQVPELTAQTCSQAKEHAVNLEIYDGEGGDIARFEARIAHRMLRHPDTAAVFVDYLGLLQGHQRDAYSEASRVSRTLVQVAKRHNVPVVALHQLNRELEKRQNKEPILSDLRDSGQIEQDAHRILFLFRPWVYDKSQDPAKVKLILAANRSGETGFIPLRWNGPTLTYFTPGAPAALPGAVQEELTFEEACIL